MTLRQPLPPGVRAVRVICYVQGGLYALSGLLLVFGAAGIARASGISGLAPIHVLAIGLAVLVLSGLVLWGGTLLGRLSQRARIGLLVYEWLVVVLGLVGLSHPGLGILNLLLAGVSVYYLQFDRATLTAFGSGDGGRWFPR